MEEKKKKKLDLNDKLICYVEAYTLSMMITSGEEALNLLCESERIYEDFELALDRPNFNVQLIVREWIDIKIEYEFRGFVVNGVLTAVSQYSDPCYFEDLIKNKSKCEKQILDFFKNTLKDTIPINSYIIDFALVPLPENEDQFKIWVIELNPYNDYEGCGAGSCLFDWKKDREVLTNGYEFRIRETYFPELNELMKKAFKNWEIEF